MTRALGELSGLVWAIEPRALERILARCASVTVTADSGMPIVLPSHEEDDATGLDVRDGVAHIAIRGPMAKSVPWIFDFLGIEATSTVDVREQLAAAVESESVKAIRLDIDSPGGTVDGTAELAEDVQIANMIKPVHAHASDMMASAAYWVGSQAGTVTAGPAAEVGSIGTVAVVHDSSRAYQEAGIDTHVVSSHELKGAFAEGSKVTPAQLADLQRNIDTFTGLFVDGVAQGRGMEPDAVRELATGQVWIGQEAKTLGLVDEIANESPIAVAVAELTAAPAATTQEAHPMAVENAKGTSVELEALRERVAQLEAEGKSKDAQIEASNEALAAAKAAQREAVISKHADKITPAMRAHVSAVHPDDNEALDAFLSSLPEAVRPEEVGANASNEPAAEAPEDTDEAQALADFFPGLEPKWAAMADQVKAFTGDGRLVLNDGREVAISEVV